MNSYGIQESGGTFDEMLESFKVAVLKFWRAALPPTLMVLALTVVVAVFTPSYYTSHSLVYIQPQRITSKIVDAPEKGEMRNRLDALVQEILSRPKLRSISESYNLYPHLTGVAGKEKAILKFRNAISITPIKSAIGDDEYHTFQLAFTHTDRQTAFEVTKILTNLFIEESLVARRIEVEGTEEFLDSQIAEARRNLEQTEALVQEFMTRNSGRLPEHLRTALTQLQNSRSQLVTNSEVIAANSARRSYLQDELSTLMKASVAASGEFGTAASGDPYENLAQLESALAVLETRYSDKHPDVVSTKNRIASLQEQIKKDKKSGKSSASTGLMQGSPAVLRVKRELKELDIQIATLKDENKRLKKSIATLENNVELMPIKEQELIKIRRDYDNSKADYQRLLAARKDTALEASMLKAQKGSRFRLVEPAELPILPAGPMRWLIAGLGFVSALLLFISMTVAKYSTNSSYKRRAEVEQALEVPVLGVVPAISTPQVAMVQRRSMIVSAATCSSIFVLATIVFSIVVYRL